MSDEKITPQQAKAIAALLRCESDTAAAKHVGIHPKTLQRWRKDESFMAALNAATGEAIQHTSRRMAFAVSKACTVLIRAMRGDEITRLQVSAAQSVITLLPQLRMMGDIEARLAELEIAKVQS